MKTVSDSNFPERLGHGDSPRGSTDRFFGLLFSAFWGVVAIAPLRRGGSIRAWVEVLAAAFLVTSLIRPTLLGPLNQLWQRLGKLLQKLTNPIVMAVLYFFDHRPVCSYNAPAEQRHVAIEVGSLPDLLLDSS